MSLSVHAHNARTNTVKRIRLKTNTLAKKKKWFILGQIYSLNKLIAVRIAHWLLKAT